MKPSPNPNVNTPINTGIIDNSTFIKSIPGKSGNCKMGSNSTVESAASMAIITIRRVLDIKKPPNMRK